MRDESSSSSEEETDEGKGVIDAVVEVGLLRSVLKEVAREERCRF